MKILVTGSSGFLGQYFVDLYRDAGHTVREVDIAHRLPVDCREFFRLDRKEWDLAIHCAAIVGGRQTIDKASHLQYSNLELDVSYWRWLMEGHCERAIYLSSSAAYPIRFQGEAPVRLSENLIDLRRIEMPDSFYGWEKLTGEMMFSDSALSSKGVKVGIVRPFSGYGSDQSLDYPFPSFVQRALRKEDPFVIWGSGKQVRDWVHVGDIVDCVDRVAFSDAGAPVNIGTGVGTSMVALATKICEQVGYEPRFSVLEDAPMGVQHRVADIERMSTWYTPCISLEEGICMALEDQSGL